MSSLIQNIIKSGCHECLKGLFYSQDLIPKCSLWSLCCVSESHKGARNLPRNFLALQEITWSWKAWQVSRVKFCGPVEISCPPALTQNKTQIENKTQISNHKYVTHTNIEPLEERDWTKVTFVTYIFRFEKENFLFLEDILCISNFGY